MAVPSTNPMQTPNEDANKFGYLRRSTLSLDERLERCLSVGEECIHIDELRALLASKDHPVCYDGFEPSGRMHIAQGIMKAAYVNKLTSCGCLFLFWVADWFALMNNKLSANLERIRVTGEYYIEIWKALGMDMTNVRFLWASDEIEKNPNEYWAYVMAIARTNTLARLKRCSTIMGRAETADNHPMANVLYPCMQCADVFFLKADICQLGIDQRKVNMLAREYCDEIGRKPKPVILSHIMLPGLKEDQMKMSKSDPDSAVFMEDTEEEIRKKIQKAFCPPKIVDENPCIIYVEKLVFEVFNNMEIERAAENGGPIRFATAAELKSCYVKGGLHPADLKEALIKYLNKMIAPVRQHFAEDVRAQQVLAAMQNHIP